MADKKRKLDETEEIFKEYYDYLDRIEAVKSDLGMEQRKIFVEFLQLSDHYEKLLKTAVRISRLGDKAQQKLMKYKEVMDTLRNVE